MTNDSFIGLVRAVRRAGTRPPTSSARAARILTDHRDQVDVLAAALIERRALTGRQVHDLLQRQPEKK